MNATRDIFSTKVRKSCLRVKMLLKMKMWLNCLFWGTRNTFEGISSLFGEKWSPLRALSASGQIQAEDRPPPSRQCLYFGNKWSCNPSLTVTMRYDLFSGLRVRYLYPPRYPRKVWKILQWLKRRVNPLFWDILKQILYKIGSIDQTMSSLRGHPYIT